MFHLICHQISRQVTWENCPKLALFAHDINASGNKPQEAQRHHFGKCFIDHSNLCSSYTVHRDGYD